MTTIKRTSSENSDFQNLVVELDKDLASKNGDSNDFFAQFNKIDIIQHVIVAYENGLPIGCGALKQYEKDVMEIKRMYVIPTHRGKGISKTILTALVTWAKELGYIKCILETGDTMTEAIALYKRCNFKVIPNYPPYTNVNNSICFEKQLWQAL